MVPFGKENDCEQMLKQQNKGHVIIWVFFDHSRERILGCEYNRVT